MLIRIVLSVEFNHLKTTEFDQRGGLLNLFFFFLEVTALFAVRTEALTVRSAHIESFQLISKTPALRLQKQTMLKLFFAFLRFTHLNSSIQYLLENNCFPLF